jgi:hypothetical protein
MIPASENEVPLLPLGVSRDEMPGLSEVCFPGDLFVVLAKPSLGGGRDRAGSERLRITRTRMRMFLIRDRIMDESLSEWVDLLFLLLLKSEVLLRLFWESNSKQVRSQAGKIYSSQSREYGDVNICAMEICFYYVIVRMGDWIDRLSEQDRYSQARISINQTRPIPIS